MEGADPRPAGDSRKRMRSCEQPTPVDRLSALPDSLLLHILSFLRMEDVVISTARLSRRWSHLWTSTPCLDFSPRYECRLPSGTEFIDRVLILHEGAKIRRFRASVVRTFKGDSEQTHAEISKRADSWVRFAVSRRVEELELKLLLQSLRSWYKLPLCVFSCDSLVSLTLEYCRLEPPSRISMSSLRILTLCRVTIGEDDDNLKGLLAGCPSLEYLALQDLPHFFDRGVRVEGSNSRLRTLKIGDTSSCGVKGILISAPSIKELVLQGLAWPYLAKNHFNSIVTASLEFRYARRDFASLLGDLRHVKALKLSSWCVQSRNDKETAYAMSNERPSATMLQHLKTVTIFGLVREICRGKRKKTAEKMAVKCRNGLEFIGFLLKNSPVLERLTINAVDNVNKLTKGKLGIVFGFASRLLALPRASPNARVIIRDE